MKKESVLLLVSSLLLAGCENQTSSSAISSISEQEKSNESSENSEIKSEISTSESSTQSEDSTSTISESSEIQIFNESNDITLYEYLNVLDFLDQEQYDFAGFIKPDTTYFETYDDGNFRMIKEGMATLNVLLYDLDFNEIKASLNLTATPFHFTSENLSNKTITIFGDSISDSSVSNYETKPTFWSEILEERYNLTVYNHAVSGSTLSCSKGFADNNGAYSRAYVGVAIYQNVSKNHLKEADYTFIYYGNNDFTYGTRIGDYGEVNDDNIMSKESFKGAYSYLVNKIRETNPKTRIIMIGLSTSSWPIASIIKNDEHANTRQELNEVCKEIASDLHLDFVDVYGLWTAGSSEYCGDGIHPLTLGYEKIVEQILNM